MRKTEMLVISFRGINQGFWPHLSSSFFHLWCSHQNATVFSCQSIFYGAPEEKMTTKNASISIFSRDFCWSLKSGLLVAGFFPEQWLVMEPILYSGIFLAIQASNKAQATPR